MSKIARSIVHLVTNIRSYQYKQVAKVAKTINSKHILEIGSGPLVSGKYHYSTKHLFSDSNDFVQSDIVKSFGHPIIDVTKMKYKDKFDVVLCLNVLEHVYDFQKAIDNMHSALKKDGLLIVAVPAFYPLHDEPGDYWRFTEHALKRMFAGYKIRTLIHNGKREYPFTYYLEAKK
jgi:SAM-dependent methyltransferase